MRSSANEERGKMLFETASEEWFEGGVGLS